MMLGRVLGAWTLFFVATASTAAWAGERFLGAESCGTCHAAEYAQWKTTGHASAWARLSKHEQGQAACRSCHTMARDSDDPQFTGVQCESCHGGGSLYAPKYIMQDPVLREMFGLKKIAARTCAGCHREDSPSLEPFVFEHKVKLIRHREKSS